MVKKKIVIIFPLMLAVFLFFSAAHGQTIKIGIILPLSGPVAYEGNSKLFGAKIAAEEINAKGGVLGRPIELVPEDGVCNPAQSVSAAEKLIVRDKVPALTGAYCSSATAAVMPVAKQYGVPFVTGVSGAPNLTEQGNEWFFRAQLMTRLLAESIADTLYNDLGIKKPALLIVNDDWGRAVDEEYSKALKKLGAEIAGTEVYNRPDTDYTTYLTKIKAKNPDSLGLAAYAQHAAQITKQLKELGMSIKVWGEGGITTDAFLKAAGKAAVGVYGIQEYVWTLDTPQNKAFVEKFRSRHTDYPTKYSAAGVVTVNIVAQAVERAGKVEPKAIRDALRNTDYNGYVGNFRFDEKGQAYNMNYFLIQIQPDLTPKILKAIKVEKPKY